MNQTGVKDVGCDLQALTNADPDADMNKLNVALLAKTAA
jgi:hypothetical protein